jgi:ankyrin repeat protein
LPSNETHSKTNPLENWEKIFLFHRLASSGQSQRIEHLFQRKYFLPNQFYHDYLKRTPAHSAAANGHINVIQVLLKYNFIGLFQSDQWGLTPFHHAQLNHFKPIQQLLILTKF